MKVISLKNLFVCFILLFTSFTSAEDWNKVRKAIEEMNDKLEKAIVAEDMKTIFSYYSQDVISLPDYKPAIRGLNNLVEDYKKDLADGFKYNAAEFNTTDFFGSGDLAVEIGEWDVTFTLPGMTEKMRNQGKYVTTWQKQSDGSWKIKAETWNTNSFPEDPKENDNISERNKSMVESFFLSFGQDGRLEQFKDFFHQDHKFHFPTVPQPLDAIGHIKMYEDFVRGFPDAKIMLDESFASEDKVVLRGKFTGTQTGEFNKIPPTGKMINLPFIAIVKIKDGKNLEEWVEMDTSIMMKQLGLLPELSQQ